MAKQTTPQPPAHPPLLDKPRVLFGEAGALSQWVFYGGLLLLGSAGALGCLFGAFEVPASPWPCLGVGAVSLLFALALFLGRRSWAVALGGIGLWAGAVCLWFQDLVQGCGQVINLALAAYEEKLGLALPRLAVDPLAAPADIARQCTLFCCLFTLPYLFFLGWALIGRKSGLGAFCLTGGMVLFPMAISLVPPAPYVALLLLFWAVLLLFSPTLGRRHRLLEDRSQYFSAGGGAARPAMLALFALGAAACMGAVWLLFPQTTYQRPQIAQDIRTGLTQGFGLEAALEGGLGNGNGRVDLSSMGERSYTGETALRVRYEWEVEEGAQIPEKAYLKSFVGSRYTGSSWERLSRAQRRELSQILEGLQPQSMAADLGELFEGYPPYQNFTLEVVNLEANPRCVYTPYGLVQGSVDSGALHFVDDGFVESARLFSGTPSYQVQGTGLYSLLYQSRMELPLLGAASQAAQEDPAYLTVAQELAEGISADTGLRTQREADLWQIPQQLRQLLTPQQQAYTQSLEAYNAFVYENYTQLPDGLKERLLALLEEESGLWPQALEGNAPSYYVQAITQQVVDFLAQRCGYTLSPTSPGPGEDFVEHFLFESRQGFCVHFASAAVALLRALGIPARYAEGYAVPCSREGWVDVPDYNAHAWVEIYYGGGGWVPLEATPAGPDAPAAYYNAQHQSQEEQPPTATPQPTPSPSPTPEEASSAPGAEASPEASPLPAAGSTGEGFPWWGWLGAALGAAALLVAGCLARRQVVLALRRRRFSQKDPNQAALALYAWLLRLCREGARLAPGWQRTPPAQLEQLALKARFSQHTLTPEELAPFREELALAQAQLGQALSPARRLWCRLGPVLF